MVPVEGEPIPDGWVTTSGGRIVAVGRRPQSDCLMDLGEVALVPGLINAHTHLEFSLLDEPLGGAVPDGGSVGGGDEFSGWIRGVIRWRREQDASGRDWRAVALRRGWQESLAAGVTWCGEIAPSAAADLYDRAGSLSEKGPDPLRRPSKGQTPFRTGVGDQVPLDQLAAEVARPTTGNGLPGTVFLEVLGLAAGREDDLMATAAAWLNGGGDRSAAIVRGVSPHAPYTVSLPLLERLCELSRRRCAPLAMHLAESRDELELLRAATGPLRELLEEIGAWREDAFGGRRPIDYLARLAQAHRALLVHGNYLAADEIELAARSRDQLSVVYCPRTHRFFRHAPYPLETMLDAGVRVVVGTDSRASNPSLNVWDELRAGAELHPGISPAKWLKMATLDAAVALDCVGERGSLRPGKRADLAAIAIARHDRQNPYEALLGKREPPAAVFVAGVPYSRRS